MKGFPTGFQRDPQSVEDARPAGLDAVRVMQGHPFLHQAHFRSTSPWHDFNGNPACLHRLPIYRKREDQAPGRGDLDIYTRVFRSLAVLVLREAKGTAHSAVDRYARHGPRRRREQPPAREFRVEPRGKDAFGRRGNALRDTHSYVRCRVHALFSPADAPFENGTARIAIPRHGNAIPPRPNHSRRLAHHEGPIARSVCGSSAIGRTSTHPIRAPGILEATWIASFKSLAAMT